jgi:hypothetical protein
MSTYEVEDYSVSNLGARLYRHSHQGAGYSEAKSHLSYFDEYLSSVGAKTILIENPYTDRDYLEDYAAYYARCHAEYAGDARVSAFSGAASIELSFPKRSEVTGLPSTPFALLISASSLSSRYRQLLLVERVSLPMATLVAIEPFQPRGPIRSTSLVLNCRLNRSHSRSKTRTSRPVRPARCGPCSTRPVIFSSTISRHLQKLPRPLRHLSG